MKQMLGLEKSRMWALLALALLMSATAAAAPQASEGGEDGSRFQRTGDGVVRFSPPCESGSFHVPLSLTEQKLNLDPEGCICSSKGKEELIRMVKDLATTGGRNMEFEEISLEVDPGEAITETLYCYPVSLLDAFREPESSENPGE